MACRRVLAGRVRDQDEFWAPPHSNPSLSVISLAVLTDSRDLTVCCVSRIIAEPRVSRHGALHEMQPWGRQLRQVGQCEMVVSSAAAQQAARLTTSRSSSRAVLVGGHKGHRRF